MGKRERMDRTWRHCVTAKRLWVRYRTWSSDSPEERAETAARSLGFFRKSSGAGCRGSKKGSRCSPKLGSCCKTGCSYRESVQERIAGNRLVKRWMEEISRFDPLDVDL